MCEPATLATIAIIGSAMSAGVSAFGAYKETQAANASAEYNARVSERNKQIADMQANQARQQGEVDARAKAREISKLIGSQRAGFAGSGMLVDTGSAQDITEETAAFGALDAMTIRRNAANQAWGYQVQGLNYQSQADLARMSKRNPYTAAGTTLLTGAADTFKTAAFLA